MFPWHSAQWQQWQQQSNRLGHAYLLSGAQGIGLYDFATLMAQGLLCQTNALEPCMQCAQCHQFQQQTHPDFFNLTVLADKKEVSVDQVRELSDKIYATSHQGGFKVALIESVEKLNNSAFNALLKTLEEPPAQTVLILITHQISRLPATIVSRCRQIAFATPPQAESLAWLQTELPQADLPLLKKALKLNWGGAVAAKTWVDDKGYEQESAWREDIQALQQGKQSVSQVVEKWKKWPAPEACLDYFYLWTVGAVRAALYQQKMEYNPNWLVFQKNVLQAKQFWTQNVNKDLLLESVCLVWLQHQQPDYVFDDALSSQWIRGDHI